MEVRFNVGVGYVNCDKTEVITIPDEDVEGLDERGVERLLDQELEDWIWNYVESWWEIVEEDDED
jgi:hypothetical protein